MGLVALLAAASLLVGVVSVLALDRFLLGRLDMALTSAEGRSRTNAEGPGGGLGEPDDNGHPAFLFAPGQAEGTLAARIAEGMMQSGVLGSTGEARSLSSAADSRVAQVPADGQPRTVDLGAGLGSYRLVAVSAPDGDVIVTGLPLSGVEATTYRLAAVIAAVTALALVAAVLAGGAVVRLGLRPLRRVAGTARRVAELPLDRGEVVLAERVPAADTDQRTEVGQVGAALNHMLEHVAGALAARQASEMRVRHFVADASHELRSPIAVIRGYAELARRQRAELPPDVARSLARVEAEAVRMTGLVEDLLLLARLDAGRPVERRPVDLVGLVVDALSDAHAVAPDHRWDLRVPHDPLDGELVVSGDAARLHQVVANLLGNARMHTPPGTSVTVSVERGYGPAEGPLAVLRVLDDGPGVPADLQPEVFERFTRGDSARTRTAGSTGLGLAIVAAIVEAHGGTVRLQSRPGRTELTVRLPLTVPDRPQGPHSDRRECAQPVVRR